MDGITIPIRVDNRIPKDTVLLVNGDKLAGMIVGVGDEKANRCDAGPAPDVAFIEAACERLLHDKRRESPRFMVPAPSYRERRPATATEVLGEAS